VVHERDKGGAVGDGLRGLRVLVVEDEAVITLDLEAWLGESGCTVLSSAGSVESALAALDRERPDVAILDVVLGRDHAAPVARALRASDVPFVVVTGSGPDIPTSPAFDGAPRLDKPFDPEALRAALLTPTGAKPP
jgi:DNA-binding response OmpR family regulator